MKQKCFSCNEQSQKYASGLCEDCHQVAITTSIIGDVLGSPGAMLSGSKRDYSDTHPDNLVVFNSNVCVKKLGKVWFGDLDVSRSMKELKKVAAKLNKDVYVLYEMDARFTNERSPRFEKAACVFKPDGAVEIGKELKDLYEIRQNLVVKKKLDK